MAPRPVRLAAALLALCLPVASAGSDDGRPPHPPAAAGEPVRIPGTHVSLRVPEGFSLSEDFPGIGRGDDLTSILVSRIDAPLARSREDFTAEALAGEGVRLRRADPVRVDGRDGLLMHATQHAGGLTFRKWILLLGDERRSVLLTATAPLDLESVHQRALVETLRTATWSPEEAPADTALPFRLREVPPLRIVDSEDDALVLTDPDHDAATSVPPLVLVGASTSHVRIGDLAAFSRRRLGQTVSIEEIEVGDERPRTLDGLPGHEIRAVARDTATGRAVSVTQVLATDGRRYFLVQGIADAEDAAGLAPVLDALIESFELAE